MSFATAMTVMTLNVHNKGQRGAEVPSIVRKICFGVLAKILCIKMHSTGGVTTEKVRIILEYLPNRDHCNVVLS